MSALTVDVMIIIVFFKYQHYICYIQYIVILIYYLVTYYNDDITAVNWAFNFEDE